MTKLVLWDIDGTLVFFHGVGRRAAERAFVDAFGLERVAERTENVNFAGATDGKIFRQMAGLLGIPEGDYERHLEPLKRAYLQHLSREIQQFDRDPVLPNVREVLARLARRGDCRSGLLTGNYEMGARLKLNPTGLNTYFPVGGFGDDHEDRRIVASVARERASAFHQIRVEPEKVIVIGDTIHDVDCARANGFRCIAVCTGRFNKKELLDSGADVVLDDLRAFHEELI